MKRFDYMTPFIFIVTSVCLLQSTVAQANIKLIKKLDLDKDGQITIKEAVADLSVLASFGKIDTDGDGKISSIELSKTKVVLSETKKI